MVFDWGFWCFSDIEGNITNKSIYALSFLVGKHREPQSINAKLFLPTIPIGIVAYALTLLLDNLCRNSCISRSRLQGAGCHLPKAFVENSLCCKLSIEQSRSQFCGLSVDDVQQCDWWHNHFSLLACVHAASLV